MQRPLKIGETRVIDATTGQIAKTRRGGYVESTHSEVITAELQLQKLKGLCDDPVTDEYSFKLAIKAAREARLCLTRAEKAMRSTLKAIEEDAV